MLSNGPLMGNKPLDIVVLQSVQRLRSGIEIFFSVNCHLSFEEVTFTLTCVRLSLKHLFRFRSSSPINNFPPFLTSTQNANFLSCFRLFSKMPVTRLD